MSPRLDDDPHPRHRWTLGTLALAVAMVAGNLALWAVVSRSYGRFAAVALVVINAVFCLIAAPAVGFRLVPVLAVFTTAELTEAMLLQSATSPDASGTIAAVAVLGGLALLALGAGFATIHRGRRRDQDG